MNAVKTIVLGTLFLALCLAPASGRGVVTDCTGSALQAQVDQGGLVTFDSDCSITLSSTIRVHPGSTTIDAAGHQVILSGSNTVQLMRVGGNLALVGLTFANGRGTNGGALYIQPGALVTATNCTFTGNSAVGVTGAAGLNGGDNNNGVAGDGANGSAGTSGLGGAIYNAGILTLRNCTLSTNSATGGSGGNGGNGGNGGGTLSEGGNGGNGANGAPAFGGAIYNYSNLVIINCTFDGNTAVGGDGGLGGTNGSGTFPGLSGKGGGGAVGSGGAVYNAKNLNLRMSTFHGNIAFGGNSATGGNQSNGTGSTGARGADAAGGAVWSTYWGIVTNCTFFNNGAVGGNGGDGGPGSGTFSTAGNGGDGGNASGGGLHNAGTLTVVNCTVSDCGAWAGTNGVAGSGNFSGTDGAMGQGLGGDIANGSGTFTLVNSILSTNVIGGNGSGTITDAGHNLSSDASLQLTGPGSSINTDPKLAAAAFNGGPTETMALLSGSPAIDKVPATAAPTTDQRGYPRPLPKTNSLADIGAYEYELSAAPIFIQVPTDQVVLEFSNATFTGRAIGKIPLTYQWKLAGTNLPGATTTSLTVTNATPSDAGPYVLAVTNDLGWITSPEVSVGLAPAIVTPPTDQAVVAGGSATFTVVATGDALNYQWKFNGTDVSGADIIGATTNSLTITEATTNRIGSYTVEVSSRYGHVTSSAAALNLLPTILAQPQDQTTVQGSNAAFSVVAVGSTNLSYQWRFNGVSIAGATNSVYGLTPVSTNNAGSYDVVVTNPYGQTNSRRANLTVNLPGFTFSISGQVGSMLLPVQVLLIQGARTNQATTDLAGNYSFGSLSAGDYIVQPVPAACRHFLPGSLSVTVGPTNAAGVNFTSVADAYFISGRFTNGLAGVSNVLVTLTPGAGAFLTGPDGAYGFSNLCAGTYTLNASAGVCYQIAPPARSVTVGPANALGQDFAATPDVYTISGTIVEGAQPLGGVQVQVAGKTNVAFTLGDGSYTLDRLCPGTYDIIPVLACQRFSPTNRTITVGPSVSQMNFTAYTNDVFSIWGRVTTNGVDGLADVQVQSSGRSTTTDANGYYLLSNICPGTNQVVATKDGYGFNPAVSNLVVTGDMTGVDFLAFPAFSIAGTVSEVLGGTTNPLSGLSVQVIGGGTNLSVLTTNDGSYFVSGLASNAYTVTPILSCYLFAPTNRLVQLDPTNATGVDFFATHDNVHTISGNISEGGVGLSNVLVRITGFGLPNTPPDVFTDSAGNYLFDALCSAVYTVTPTQACQSFFPPSHTVALTPTGPDAVATDFSAYRTSFTIRGHITAALGGGPLTNVAVSAAGQTSFSDTDGNYVLVGLCPGLYTVQPLLSRRRFDQVSVNLSSDTNLDFTGFPVLALSRATNGLAQIFFGAAAGLGYRLEASTNLVNWQSLLVTNNLSARMTLLQLIDTDSRNFPSRFYRLGEFPWLVIGRGTNGLLQVSFVASPGVNYQLQASPNPTLSNSWQDIFSTNVPTGPRTIQYFESPTNSARFYRLGR